MCIECEDQPASVSCSVCEDDFCEVCFQALHQKGNRRRHKGTPLELPESLQAATKRLKEDAEAQAAEALARRQASDVTMDGDDDDDGTDTASSAAAAPAPAPAALDAAAAAPAAAAVVEAPFAGVVAASGIAAMPAAAAGRHTKFDSDDSDSDSDGAGAGGHGMGVARAVAPVASCVMASFADRSRFVPLRLTFEERKKLRLVEAALNVSEYTDNVDVLSGVSKDRRIITQIRDICAILSGLLVASDYRAGQRLVSTKEFKDNAAFFQDLFEVARRHKVRACPLKLW
jgi:hypothetical protein